MIRKMAPKLVQLQHSLISDILLIRGNIGAQDVGRIKVKLSYIDY